MILVSFRAKTVSLRKRLKGKSARIMSYFRLIWSFLKKIRVLGQKLSVKDCPAMKLKIRRLKVCTTVFKDLRKNKSSLKCQNLVSPMGNLQIIRLRWI